MYLLSAWILVLSSPLIFCISERLLSFFGAMLRSPAFPDGIFMRADIDDAKLAQTTAYHHTIEIFFF